MPRMLTLIQNDRRGAGTGGAGAGPRLLISPVVANSRRSKYVSRLPSLPCLAVECATARLSMRTGLISRTEPGTNPAQGAKLGQSSML